MIIIFASSIIGQEEKTYKINSVDKLQMIKSGEKYRIHLWGNVDFIIDNIEFFSDFAEIDEHNQTFEMKNNVRAVMDTLTIYSDYAHYSKNTEELIFRNNVHFTTPNNYEFYSDSVRYSRKNNILEALGKNRGYDKLNDYRFTNGLMIFYRELNRGVLKEEPVIHIHRDDSEISISADLFELYQERNEIFALKNVRIAIDSIIISSQSAVYYDSLKFLRLTGDVKSRFGDNYMTGGIAECFMNPDYDVDSIVVYSEPRIYYKEKEENNKSIFETNFSGEKMKILLENETEIKELIVEKNASNQYTEYDSLKIKKSENSVKSDKMRVFFDDNKVVNIRITDNISGTINTDNGEEKSE